MKPADAWPLDCGDGCGNFFGACLHASGLELPENASVLDVGCAEYDWLTQAHAAWPSMTVQGVDWRASQVPDTPNDPTRLRDDARKTDLYAPESFDWIVSISAIEHMGLGHYENDPVDPDGDTKVLANCWRWLKPGGWLTFDVPYDPHQYYVAGTSHRVYDDSALWDRLWMQPLADAKCTAKWHVGPWYATSGKPGELIHKPAEAPNVALPRTLNVDGIVYTERQVHAFYYVGFAFQKL